jgi:hypothetical protein
MEKNNIEIIFPDEMIISKKFLIRGEIMVSQNAIPSKQYLGGYLPLVFTEYGVLQLANVLKSGKVTQVSIKIIEIFVKMRSMLMDTLTLKLDIDEIKKKLQNQDKNIELVFNYLDELIQKQEQPKPRNRIGFKRENEN